MHSPDSVYRALEEVRVPGNAQQDSSAPRTKPLGPGGGIGPPAVRREHPHSSRLGLRASVGLGQGPGGAALELAPAPPPPSCPSGNRTVTLVTQLT